MAGLDVPDVLRRSVALDLEQHGPSYRRAMDGYRGLFVLLVIAYHFGASWLVGGWIGINHFFVFSGFLIGTILIKERYKYGDLDVVRFYLRRARRIVPAMCLLVLAVLVKVAFFDSTPNRSQTAGDAFATLTFWQNWRLIERDDQYFDYFSDPSPLRHVWTLSVEEQFYLFVPWLILGLFAVSRRKAVRVWMLVALAAASAAWTSYLVGPGGGSGSRLYYGTDVRMQALIVGVAGAAMYTAAPGREKFRLPRGITNAIGWIGTIVSLSAFFLLDDRSTGAFRYGGLFCFAVLAAFMGISALDTRRLTINRVIGIAPLVHLGQISYGLYLYHWPISLWLRFDSLPALVNGLLQFLLTWVCAVASYRLVELPILMYGLRGSVRRMLRRRVPRATGFVTVAVLAAIAAGLWNSLPQTDSPPWNGQPLDASVRYVAPTTPVRMAVVGDSIPSSLVEGFHRSSYPGLQMTRLATYNGCNPVPVTLAVLDKAIPEDPGCAAWRERWPGQARAAGSDVILAPAGLAFLFPLQIDGRVVQPGSPEAGRLLLRSLDALYGQFKTTGARRLDVVNVPCRVLEPAQLRGRSAELVGREPVPIDTAWANRLIGEWRARHQGDVSVLDLSAQLCPAGEYRRTINGARVYKDSIHFSQPGAELIWSWLAPQVVRVEG